MPCLQVSVHVQVIVLDEIGTSKEVSAIRNNSQRGVAVVATVHGTSLQQLLANPVLNPLVGGKQRVILGDIAAR